MIKHKLYSCLIRKSGEGGVTLGSSAMNSGVARSGRSTIMEHHHGGGRG